MRFAEKRGYKQNLGVFLLFFSHFVFSVMISKGKKWWICTEPTFLLLPPLSLLNQKISQRFFTTSFTINLALLPLLLLRLLRPGTRTPFRLCYHIRRRYPSPECCLHRRIGTVPLDRRSFPTPTAELGAEYPRLDHLPWLTPPPPLPSLIRGPTALHM